MSRTRAQHGRARGLTLIELVLALALASALVLLLVTLLDTTLTMWRKTEERRGFSEVSSAISDLLATDLEHLEGGPRGDLLVDWQPFDLDADGVPTLPLARIRLVRSASPAEVERFGLGRRAPSAGLGLFEVCYLLLPVPPAQVGDPRDLMLWRGLRLAGAPDSPSYFAGAFLGSGGQPPAGSVEEVCGGVLWLELLCAASTTDLESGWKAGLESEQARASWDARGLGRPKAEAAGWNEAGEAMRSPRERPELPRRARIAFEYESERERKRRALLRNDVDLKETRLQVSDGSFLPDAGALLLVGEEWMLLRAVNGNEAQVERGLRGTRAAEHRAGLWVRHGRRFERELVVPVAQGEWRP